MKTKAHCPTCNYPFSFWRVVFLYSPFTFYCKNCRTRIVINWTQAYIGGVLAGLTLITVVLANFIVPRDSLRLLVLAALWLVLFEVLQIIVSLIIVNRNDFAKPDDET